MRAFILLSVLVCVLLCGCAANTSHSPDWQLIYAHDKDGNPESGDKQRLLQLVREGRPVRVYWPIRDVVEHVADAGFMTVMNGEVFAQIDGIVRQIPDRETRKRIALDAEGQSRWHAVFATTGELRSFQSAEGNLGDYRFPLKWYVLTP